MLTAASLLAEAVRRHPARPAITFGDHSLTYSDLWQLARQLAAALAAEGLGPGSRVAVLLPNLPAFPIAYYGILAAGAVVVPVHALLKAEEVAFVLRHSGAALLISVGPLLAEGRKGAALVCVPVWDAAALPRAPAQAGFVAREATDTAVILYTSGTTGKPKGAELSHLNVLFNAEITATQILSLRPEDVLLGCLPLFHSFGQTCAMNAAFQAGAQLVLMPRFAGAPALELLVRHQVTVFQGVPTMYVGLLEAAARTDARPTLRLAVSGGAALPLKVIEDFERIFGAAIQEGYGLSETSPVATFNQAAFGRKPGTVGCAIWGTQVAICDPADENGLTFLPVGEVGEVVLRGHNVMKGYLEDPEATRAAIVEGWFRSGDLGTLDAEGFLTIVDRKKDMVNRGGFKIFPREVEEHLLRHPAVAQVAVIGLPDPTHGEEVCAVVVVRPGTVGDEVLKAELIAWASARLAAYKYPRRVEFVDQLPLGPSAKVLKRELVARFH